MGFHKMKSFLLLLIVAFACCTQVDSKECKKDTTLCTKYVLDGEVSRGCYRGTGKSEGCISRGNTTECFCSSDLCNSSSHHGSQGLLIVGAMALASSLLFRK